MLVSASNLSQLSSLAKRNACVAAMWGSYPFGLSLAIRPGTLSVQTDKLHLRAGSA